MAFALMLPVALLLLPFSWCQTSLFNQFIFPAPREIGAVAVSFQYGNTYNIEWETTADSYYLLFGSEDRGPYAQTYNLSGIHGFQVTSPYSFYVGGNINASLGGFFFFLLLSGNGDIPLFESDNFLPINDTASPAQLSSAGVTVASVMVDGTASSTVATSTNTPSTTSSTAIATVITKPTVTASSLQTTPTSSPTSSITTSATANPAAGINTLAVGLGVGLGVPLALAILTTIYFLIRHQRAACRAGEKGDAGIGSETGMRAGVGTDVERYNEPSTTEGHREPDRGEYRAAELEETLDVVEAGSRPVIEMQ